MSIVQRSYMQHKVEIHRDLEIMMEGPLQVLKFFHRNFRSFFYSCVHQHAVKTQKFAPCETFMLYGTLHGLMFSVRMAI